MDLPISQNFALLYPKIFQGLRCGKNIYCAVFVYILLNNWPESSLYHILNHRHGATNLGGEDNSISHIQRNRGRSQLCHNKYRSKDASAVRSVAEDGATLHLEEVPLFS